MSPILYPTSSAFPILIRIKKVENEQRASIPAKQGTSPEQTSALEESIFKLSGQLSTITRNQKYFRTRENRNFSTVRSTERRIFNFSVIESLMMVCMAGLQVFIVRFFFQVCFYLSRALCLCKGNHCANSNGIGCEERICMNDSTVGALEHWDGSWNWMGMAGVETFMCTFIPAAQKYSSNTNSNHKTSSASSHQS